MKARWTFDLVELHLGKKEEKLSKHNLQRFDLGVICEK